MSALLRASDEQFVPMTVADLDEVVTIETDIYRFPWTRGNFLDSLNSGYSCWTLRGPDGGLMAYSIVMVALDEAHLLNLSVARHCQRFGYGWRALEWMAQQARDHGALSMFLEVRPTNLPAQRLYARYGFERIGMRRGYYPAEFGREDAIVMRIAL
jgi:ribosomal-protein-alanine N-acetyltransferase